MGIKCPKCHSDNPETKRFCGECGTQIIPKEEIPVTETIVTPKEELTRGTTLAGRYEIIEELGRGGMGNVYRVEDKKTKEELALKLIKPEIASDKKTLERFSNELKLAHKISHKNVCRMYHLGEEEGVHFITMEYIPGEDLKSMIRMTRQLTVGTAISMAKQVCDGLEEAHRLGVIHRDLKPSNIMIDKAGTIRIMDFGIARSLKTKGITGTGVMIGTPEYMSPEQVEGKEADPHSDIYSLGIILFEVLTGRLPFEGDTAFAIGLKHKSEAPENPRKLNSQIPEDLSRLILKCLEKDKENRYQSAEELRSELIRIEEGIPTTERVIPKRKPITSREITVKFSLKKLFMPALVFVALAILISISVVIINRLPSEKPFLPTHKQLTFKGNTSAPAISPDGKFIAYANRESFDEEAIFVQDIVSEHSIEVFRMRSCLNLRWMPDSSEICVSGQGLDSKWGLFIIPRLGGTPRRAPHYFPWFALSPDGTQFAGGSYPSKNITFFNKTTGEIKSIPLGASFTWFYDIDWSPKGNLILFLTLDKGKYTIWTINTDGSNQQKVIEESVTLSSPRWSPRGDAIYYQRGGELQMLASARFMTGKIDLWKIPVSLDTGKPSKSQSLVLSESNPLSFFSITNDGKKLMYARGLYYSNLWLAQLEGVGKGLTVKTRQLTSSTLLNDKPSISPDGNLIAFSRGDIEKANIFVMPVEGGSLTQVTFLDSLNFCPVWSPDGEEIAFISKEGETFKVWKINAQGGKPYQFTESETSGQIAWSPGSKILYQRPGNRNFHILNPETEEEAPLIQDESVGWIFFPSYSPDGKKIAVSWNRKGGAEDGIWVISLEDSSQVLIKEGGEVPIGWSVDGKWVYSYEVLGGEIKVSITEVETKKERIVITIPFTFELGYPNIPCMITGGKNFVIPVYKKNSDIWIVENFDSDIK